MEMDKLHTEFVELKHNFHRILTLAHSEYPERKETIHLLDQASSLVTDSWCALIEENSNLKQEVAR